MKVTLDHNCLIHLRNRTAIGEKIEAIVLRDNIQCFVVNIGASEMREDGVRPDQYDKFEELLQNAGVAHLSRLNPMAIWDVTFWDRAVWADDQMLKLSNEIRYVLFGNSPRIDIVAVGMDSPPGKKWLNQECDIQGMWCHLQNANDVFLTTDNNFTKETKLPKLIAMGVGAISHPSDL
jgi:hypothetical protein